MNDFHCTNNSTMHFHQAEHHCNLCDFTNDVSTTTSLVIYTFEQQQHCVVNFFFQETNYSLQPKVFLSLRGPPALA
ncbi:MAG: hypothetical protein ABJC12_12555 [Saprospiraceae bacterium]